jgi:hypothetical protein
MGDQFTPKAALESLSLMFWSLIIAISVKYCALVMRADNPDVAIIDEPSFFPVPITVRTSGELSHVPMVYKWAAAEKNWAATDQEGLTKACREIRQPTVHMNSGT